MVECNTARAHHVIANVFETINNSLLQPHTTDNISGKYNIFIQLIGNS